MSLIRRSGRHVPAQGILCNRAVALSLVFVCAGCLTTPTPADVPLDAAMDVLPESSLRDGSQPPDISQFDDVVATDTGTPCGPPESPLGPGDECVVRVQGRVVDGRGQPLAMKTITVCGSICWVGQTAIDGSFDVRVNDWITPSLYSVSFHGRPAHSSLFAPLGTPAGYIATFAAPLILPIYTVDGAMLQDSYPTVTTVSVGDVRLTIPADTTLEFDFEDFVLGPAGKQLRLAEVTGTARPSFAMEAGLPTVFSFAPFQLHTTKRMSVVLPNRDGLPAGSAVQFVALGNVFVGVVVDAGRPVVVGTGRVSADGLTVQTDVGTGIDLLTWLGVRPVR